MERDGFKPDSGTFEPDAARLFVAIEPSLLMESTFSRALEGPSVR
jgi:hypothetical protein